jgi:hypothetical protein
LTRTAPRKKLRAVIGTLRLSIASERVSLAIPGDDRARYPRSPAPKSAASRESDFEDRIKSLAIEEAYRLITIREGDRTERIPVIQAILRKVAVAAANGNIRAQQNYLNLLIGAEADRRVANMELLKIAIDYKEHWHHVLAERARKGTTGPEPVPHPDDVVIDYDTGKIRIDVMEEQKEAQNRLRAMWPNVEQSLKEINEEIESNPNDLSLRKTQKRMTKIVNWLRDDALKRRMRDAQIGTTPSTTSTVLATMGASVFSC